jgi:hypothetical protein
VRLRRRRRHTALFVQVIKQGALPGGGLRQGRCTGGG